MNKRTIVFYTVIALIVAWANISNPHPLYWGAWAFLTALVVATTLLNRKEKK